MSISIACPYCHQQEKIAELQAQIDEQNGILGELANTPSGAIIAALRAKIKALETTLAGSRERAARELWDKDDAITKLHRKIDELEATVLALEKRPSH